MRLGLVHVRHAVAGVHEAEGEHRGRDDQPEHHHDDDAPHEETPPSPPSPGVGTCRRDTRGAGADAASAAGGPAVRWPACPVVRCIRCVRRVGTAHPGSVRIPRGAHSSAAAWSTSVPSSRAVVRYADRRTAEGVRHVVLVGAAHEVGALPAVVQTTEPRVERLLGQRAGPPGLPDARAP